MKRHNSMLPPNLENSIKYYVERSKKQSKFIEYIRETEYDENGNEIHYKTFYGLEFWFEYDAGGNMIHSKDYADNETRYEYTFYPDGKVKTKKEYKRYKDI